MKKILYILISAALAACLFSCGRDGEPETTAAETVTEPGSVTEAEATEAPDEYAVYVNGVPALDLLAFSSSPVRITGEAVYSVADTRGAGTPELVFTGDGAPISAGDGVIRYDGEVRVSAVLPGGVVIASDPYAFSLLPDGGTLIMADDMECGELTVGVPFTWETRGKTFHADAITFTGDGGSTVIKNGDGQILCRRLVCDTPGRVYTVEREFAAFSEPGFCFVRAASVNGRPVDETSLYLDGTEKVAEYVKDGELTLPGYVKTVTFSGVDAGEIGVTSPVSLIFEQGGRASLSIRYGGDGVIKLTDKNDPPVLSGAVTVDAPSAELVWEGGEPSAEFADRYFTLDRYNGEKLDPLTGGDLSLCGDGLTLDGFALLTDGFHASVRVPYEKPLPGADSVTGGTSDGVSASLISEGGSLYLVLTADGRRCGLRIDSSYLDYALPRIFINTVDGKPVTSKETYAECTVSVLYNGGGYEDITDAVASVRGRGHSSWELDKKPYKIKFDKKTSLFGLTAAKKWVLQANHVDKSLIRNTVAARISSVLTNLPFTPHSYPCDVFVNGVYAGVYSLTEQVEINEGRIDGEKDGADVDTDYLLELGEAGQKTDFGLNMFGCELTRFAEIKNPDVDALTYEQYVFIRDYVDAADAAVKALDGYEEYIDVDSLIDWFLIHELSFNADNSFRRSVFLLKKKGGKLFLACPWDFDYAFGNFYLDLDDPVGWICLGNKKTDNYKEYIKKNWMTYLLKDPAFLSKLKARWLQVRDALYGSAMETIDALERDCAASAKSNFAVWDVLGKKIQYEKKSTAAIDSFEGSVEFLRSFIKRRYEWMDGQIMKAE